MRLIIYRFSWLHDKKVATNPMNKKDNKWFQYDVAIVLYHEEIIRYPQRITKVEPAIDK